MIGHTFEAPDNGNVCSVCCYSAEEHAAIQSEIEGSRRLFAMVRNPPRNVRVTVASTCNSRGQWEDPYIVIDRLSGGIPEAVWSDIVDTVTGLLVEFKRRFP